MKAPINFRRLYDLIQQNYSYQVFEAIKEFKAQLSLSESALSEQPIHRSFRSVVERWEFETMISDLLFEFEQGIKEVLKRAHCVSDDIDLVLRTGGSSLIPAIKEILDNQFRGKVVEHDPFTSVAAGLAIANYYQYTERQLC